MIGCWHMCNTFPSVFHVAEWARTVPAAGGLVSSQVQIFFFSFLSFVHLQHCLGYCAVVRPCITTLPSCCNYLERLSNKKKFIFSFLYFPQLLIKTIDEASNKTTIQSCYLHAPNQSNCAVYLVRAINFAFQGTFTIAATP